MTSGPTNLADFARATLGVIVAAFEEDDVELPERRYLTTGATVVGACDSVIVTWSAVRAGVAGFAETPALTDGGSARVCSLQAFIFRCGYPGPDTEHGVVVEPSEKEMNDYAAVVMTDAYVLHRGLQRAYLEGVFTDWSSRVALGSATPLEPSGGMAGTTMLIEAALH